MAKKKSKAVVTHDSFQNFGAKMGWGANKLFSGSSYGFHPITRERTLLEWMYRGSWIIGVIIDAVADDMTRNGIEIQAQNKPDEIEKLQKAMERLQVWQSLNSAGKWGRLYGGALAVAQIDGQDVSKPFDPKRVGRGQFKGFAVLDRWMVEPSFNTLIQGPSPDAGLPEFYRVTADPTTGAQFPGLYGKKIHHTRCIRFEGIDMPWWQKVSENLWSISVVERLFDRLVAFDSASQGTAQLIYKAYLRTYSIPKLRDIIAEGGDALEALMKQIHLIRDWQTNEGLTVIDADDKFEFHTYSFAGLDDCLSQFGQQLGGAAQIPLVRLFGQAPKGLNATGEADMKIYNDGIKQKQEKYFRPGLSRFIPAIALSEGISLDEGWAFTFRPLAELDEKERAELASSTTTSVLSAFEKNLITKATALRELRQMSRITGLFTNITDEEIEDAENEPPAPSELGILPEQENNPRQLEAPKKAKVGDAITLVPGVDVVIETLRGMPRNSGFLAADYGHIRGTVGHDGDNVDCFIGPKRDSARVFVIDQVDPETGQFDEHKIMFGYDSRSQAMHDYGRSYSDGAAGRVGAVKEMTMKDFRTWLNQPKLKVA